MLVVNFEDLLKIERGRKSLYRYVVGESTEKSVGFELSTHQYEFVKAIYYPPTRLYFCIVKIGAEDCVVWTKSLVDEPLFKINNNFGTYLLDISTVDDKILVINDATFNLSDDGGITWETLPHTITDDITYGLVLPENSLIKHLIGTTAGLYAARIESDVLTFTKVYDNIDIARIELNDEALLILLSDNSQLIYSTDLTMFETLLPGPIDGESSGNLSILDGYYLNDKIITLTYSTASLKLYKSVYDINTSTVVNRELDVSNSKESSRISYIQKYENPDYSVELILNGDKYSTNSGKTWMSIPESCAFVQILNNNRFIIYEPTTKAIFVSFPIIVVSGGGIPPEVIFEDGDIENGNIAIRGKTSNTGYSLNIDSDVAAVEDNIRIGNSKANKINIGELEIVVSDEKLIITKTSEEQKSFEFLWSLAPY
jgi:hypothetical protein